MTTRTVAVSVRDFSATGTSTPQFALLEVARAEPSTAGGIIVTTKPQRITITNGTGTAQLDAGAYYRLLFHGVEGVEDAFWILMPDADTAAADLWASHQIDPDTLVPLPTYQSGAAAIAALQTQLTAILAGAPGPLNTFFEIATQFGLDEATVTALQALVAGKAPLASPTFTGAPAAPTPTAGDSSTKLATTAFVAAALAALVGGAPLALDTLAEIDTQLQADEGSAAALAALVALKAPLASPALTGTPTAPTVAGATDSTTKVATTAFVQAVAAALAASVSATYSTKDDAAGLALLAGMGLF